ncbi:MAG TPA: CBS domain-containing protein [Nitrososphaeraceae archaeon]|nr:CBS domain-containing protein [Nitrososphaeraceae archaeon]
MASETQMSNLKVADYMTKDPITIKSSATLPEAVSVMASKGIGNIIVVRESDNAVAGILTEREILQSLSLDRKIPSKSLAYVVSPHSYSKIAPSETIYTAAKSMISNKTRLLVFHDSENDKLIGIITASDLVRAFRSTSSNPPIEDVMSKRIFDVTYKNSILKAVRILFKRRVGSVIVKKGEKPHGIFTERDLLTRVLSSKEVEVSEEKVGDYSTSPLITAQHGIRANEAANIMFASGIKRLPLTEDSNIVSIVTARDLVEAFQKD